MIMQIIQKQCLKNPKKPKSVKIIAYDPIKPKKINIK
jgi:hypothetical protein